MKKSFYLSGLLAFCFVLFSAVVKAAPGTPFITTNPSNVTVCTGTNTMFTLEAVDPSGTLTISYSWLLSTDGGTTWSLVASGGAYSGVTTDTLKIIASSTLTGYEYKGIATNTLGADTSTAATLTVLSIPVAGTITGASIVCMASSISLSDAVAGGTWSSLTPAVATISSTGVVTGASQGNATIDYTVSNGSCATSTTSSIRVDTIVIMQPITGPNATCVGASILLMNANVIGTGVWSANNVDATVSSGGMVLGVSGGTDVISYVFTNACNSVTSTMSVEIDNVLNHGVISGSTTVCAESWITLSETVSGGTWLSSNSGIANVDAAGNVTGVSLGSAVISYYLSNACGASIATYTVTVARAASVITGMDSVGVGATRPLSDSATGGTWTTANASIANINSASGVVTGVAAGVTTITYVVTNDCGTSSSMLTVHVGVIASTGIIGIDSVCIGTTINLSDSTIGGVWSASNGNASVSNAGLVMGLSSGLDTIYYTVTNGFGMSQQRHIIYVNHLPVLTLFGPKIIALGGEYLINGYPAGGTFSAPSSSLGEIISVSSGSYTLDSTAIILDSTAIGHSGDSATVHNGDSTTISVSVGYYLVVGYGTNVITYSYTTSCGTVDSTFTLSLSASSSGVNTVGNKGAGLNVFPNPNQGEFTVNLSSAITEDAVITVTNIVGEKVKELTISTNQPTSVTLDQPAGMYFLSATTASARYSTKITIAK